MGLFDIHEKEPDVEVLALLDEFINCDRAKREGKESQGIRVFRKKVLEALKAKGVTIGEAKRRTAWARLSK
ncbi:MAG: hypothetical protein M0R32_08140 [Candidatus Cloacimonetes bacterium]|jgi:hypothetical protein|nr:hypothetical protein [Candidatus Cloacimonadota bacterium]